MYGIGLQDKVIGVDSNFSDLYRSRDKHAYDTCTSSNLSFINHLIDGLIFVIRRITWHKSIPVIHFVTSCLPSPPMFKFIYLPGKGVLKRECKNMWQSCRKIARILKLSNFLVYYHLTVLYCSQGAINSITAFSIFKFLVVCFH